MMAHVIPGWIFDQLESVSSLAGMQELAPTSPLMPSFAHSKCKICLCAKCTEKPKVSQATQFECVANINLR